MASEFEPYPAFGTSQPAEAAAAAPDEEIKEYKIHVSFCDVFGGRSHCRDANNNSEAIQVSSKYLDLTRQKLELTRLPRDIPDIGPTTWWNPKSTVEPLIDFWYYIFMFYVGVIDIDRGSGLSNSHGGTKRTSSTIQSLSIELASGYHL